MPIRRIALSEVRVDDFVQTCIDSAEADGILTCLLTENLAGCRQRYPPIFMRTFRIDPDDFELTAGLDLAKTVVSAIRPDKSAADQPPFIG